MRSPSIIALILAGSTASAAFAGHTMVVTVTATSALGTETATFSGDDNFLQAGTVDTSALVAKAGSDVLAEGASAEGWHWSSASSVTGNASVANVGMTAVSFIDDPAVLLSFNVTAGASDTVFTISSIFVSTSPATAYDLTLAAASITATEGDTNGVTLTGLLNGASQNVYAYQNTDVSSVTTNAGYLLTGVSAGFSPGTASASDSTTSGFVGLTGIAQISSQFKFSLTANDQASGTSIYRIDPTIPAPATLALLGIGGVLAGRRRRA